MIFVIDGKDFQITNKSKLVCEVRLERNIIGKTSAEKESNPKWAGLFWTGFDDPDMKVVFSPPFLLSIFVCSSSLLDFDL